MEFGISQSPLTNNIYVGRLNKKGNEYLEKQDMTMGVIMSVIAHIKQNIEDEDANTINISSDGGTVKYSLTLEIEEDNNE